MSIAAQIRRMDLQISAPISHCRWEICGDIDNLTLVVVFVKHVQVDVWGGYKAALTQMWQHWKDPVNTRYIYHFVNGHRCKTDIEDMCFVTWAPAFQNPSLSTVCQMCLCVRRISTMFNMCSRVWSIDTFLYVKRMFASPFWSHFTIIIIIIIIITVKCISVYVLLCKMF